MKIHTKKLTTTAIFAAIICVVTTFVAVPAPAIGNINLGDIFILCSAWLLGPYGALASGIGACLADLFSGFAIYAPATFVIKLLMALVCYYSFKVLSKTSNLQIFSRAISAIFAELVMVFGYFAYECFIYDITLAASAIPFNIIQGSICSVIGTIVCSLLFKNSTIKSFSVNFAK